MRRFELGISPLLTRLGYVRPDNDPLPSEDGVRPVYSVGFYGGAVKSPGSRVTMCAVNVPGNAVQFPIAIFSPPIGGCWIQRLTLTSSSGAGGWATENETPTPAGITVQAGAVFSTELRPDDREPLNAVQNVVMGFALTNTITSQLTDFGTIPAFWWEGTRLFAMGAALADQLNASIIYESPLVGERR